MMEALDGEANQFGSVRPNSLCLAIETSNELLVNECRRRRGP
jgi:hypothetical protein